MQINIYLLKGSIIQKVVYLIYKTQILKSYGFMMIVDMPLRKDMLMKIVVRNLLMLKILLIISYYLVTSFKK